MTFTIAAMPAYNESHVIAEVILGCMKHVDKVVVIDDGSSDNTAEIAEHLGASVVRHIKNLGYGAALKSCFNTARELGADAMVLIDSDGQHNPEEIPKLLAPLKKGFDLVIGSRFIYGNGKNVPAYRKVGMKVLDFATHMAGGIKVTDTQSGFRAYGKKAIEKIQFTGDNMSAGSEILLKAKEVNLNFTEVEIHCRYDIEDCSSQNPLLHGSRVLIDILKNMMFRKPLHYFTVTGVILSIYGFFIWIFSILNLQSLLNLELHPALLAPLAFFMGITLMLGGIILHNFQNCLSNDTNTKRNSIFTRLFLK